MLLNDLEIFVYRVDDEVFELLGTVEKFSSLIWPITFRSYSTFEMWAPITEQNSELLRDGNILYIGGDKAAIIEIVNPQYTAKGEKKYLVKGRTLECLLENRILWGSYANKAKISTIMYDIVNKNCINADNENRNIPWLECAEDLELGDEISYQRTGFTVNASLEKLASNDISIGYRIIFDARRRKLIFEVQKAEDRTLDNEQGNDPVELSTEFDDILESDYYQNSQEYRNIAYVQGEAPKDAEGKETGEPRREVTVGDEDLKGYGRRELYVDARDLQSQIWQGESMRQIPLDEYMESLVSRGNDKLALFEKVEEFNINVRTFGLTQYTFDVDYKLGDEITIVDEQLGVRADVQVTGVTQSYSSRYQLELKFGFMRPTLIDKLKRLTS